MAISTATRATQVRGSSLPRSSSDPNLTAAGNLKLAFPSLARADLRELTGRNAPRNDAGKWVSPDGNPMLRVLFLKCPESTDVGDFSARPTRSALVDPKANKVYFLDAGPLGEGVQRFTGPGVLPEGARFRGTTFDLKKLEVEANRPAGPRNFVEVLNRVFDKLTARGEIVWEGVRPNPEDVENGAYLKIDKTTFNGREQSYASRIGSVLRENPNLVVFESSGYFGPWTHAKPVDWRAALGTEIADAAPAALGWPTGRWVVTNEVRPASARLEALRNTVLGGVVNGREWEPLSYFQLGMNVARRVSAAQVEDFILEPNGKWRVHLKDGTLLETDKLSANSHPIPKNPTLFRRNVVKTSPLPRSNATNALDLLKDVVEQIRQEPYSYGSADFFRHERFDRYVDEGNVPRPSSGIIANAAGWIGILAGGHPWRLQVNDVLSLLGAKAPPRNPEFEEDCNRLVRATNPTFASGTPEAAEVVLKEIATFSTKWKQRLEGAPVQLSETVRRAEGELAELR